MTHARSFLAAVALCTVALNPVLAVEGVGTPAEAQDRLKAIVGMVKSKGADAAAKMVMGADDPAKCHEKDIVCMMVDFKQAKMMVHTAVPKLVGTPVDEDVLDLDGISISKEMFGPGKAGKTKWEAKYKFARPDTKKVVPRWGFCERADDAHSVCVTISQ